MVYGDMTYEVILSRMMERVSTKYPNLDTREGSIIFNALAPAALELAIMYTELDNVLNESFVNTASREYILIGCKDIGMDISMFEEKAGIHKGVFDVEVPIGSRWNCDLYNYEVVEYVGKEDEYYTYQMLCETLGSSPNNYTGELIPITDSVDGLTYSRLTECLIEGENETSDEDIRTAYYEFVNSTMSDGNIGQYSRWCDEYDGIGNYKIFPLWNGNNTVKVSILSSSNKVASETLIEDFQEYLDPNSEGMGEGLAPIGAFVTVSTASEVPITVTANVTMKNGYTDTSVITKAIEDYFSEIAYQKTMIAYMNVGAAILNAEGVESINNLKLNGGTSDITLGDEEIPTLSNADWTVVS